ncbi:acyl-homoserine-lactone synthase [Sulfitobacter aestuarii]|uniref:Acyl-homoserine-lactone synthase n=1 Tax=Sulfitobacter aestuarii TaxID=2161676 RepID=A0ABW5U5A0_9RHOB
MIIIVDGLNRNRFGGLLDQMFALRARVFGDRLGWDVKIRNGRESDEFDALDPVYVIGVNAEGKVISCARALQTTGPHMLSEVFSDLLDGEAPPRSARLWESTRFCVDTEALAGQGSREALSRASCELMIGALEYARSAGIEDIITVIDPIMNRVLKRCDCAPYDYIGSTRPMGKVSAMAALLDTTPERIARLRAFAGITDDVFATPKQAVALSDIRPITPSNAAQAAALEEYCREQLSSARCGSERAAVEELARMLKSVGMIRRIDDRPITYHG